MSYSNVKITRSVLSNNECYLYTSGGAIYAQYSSITLESSRLSNNYVYYSGGAIYMYDANGNYKLQINDSTLNGNRANQRSGGAIYMNNRDGNCEFQINDSMGTEQVEDMVEQYTYMCIVIHIRSGIIPILTFKLIIHKYTITEPIKMVERYTCTVIIGIITFQIFKYNWKI